MKKIICVLAIFVLLSCQNNTRQSTSFFEVECVKNETPEFDFDVVSLLNENGEEYKDTVVNKTKKYRKIFRPCRDYIYWSKFYTKHDELVINSKVKMTATGKRWEFQPNKQDQVVIQYEYDDEDEENFKPLNLNKELRNRPWGYQSETGIVENEDKLWIHPFRSNQFVTNEVAPFPQVRFPLAIGKSWTSSITMYEGWGDWENLTVYSEYEVIGREDVKVPYAQVEQCWKIKSSSNFALGQTLLEYWYDENLGFVKMNYVNYEGQQIDIELAEVVDR